MHMSVFHILTWRPIPRDRIMGQFDKNIFFSLERRSEHHLLSHKAHDKVTSRSVYWDCLCAMMTREREREGQKLDMRIQDTKCEFQLWFCYSLACDLQWTPLSPRIPISLSRGSVRNLLLWLFMCIIYFNPPPTRAIPLGRGSTALTVQARKLRLWGVKYMLLSPPVRTCCNQHLTIWTQK